MITLITAPSADLVGAVTKTMLVVDIAIDRGEGSGLLSLKHRLARLLEPLEANAQVSRAREGAIERELQIWSGAILDLLLPEPRDAIRGHLLTNRHVGTNRSKDPWMLLDPNAMARLEDTMGHEMRNAKQASLKACARYVMSGSTGHIRDAVKELERAVRSQRHIWNVGLRPCDCEGVSAQLGQALALLPSMASTIFACHVRRLVAEDRGDVTIGGTPTVDLRKEDQWLSRRAWARAGNDGALIEGRFFAGELQDPYNQALERAQADEEADRRRRADAALRMKQWHEKIDAETSLALDDRGGVAIPPRPDLQLTPETSGSPHPARNDAERMSPAMAQAVQDDLDRRAREDEEWARRRRAKEQYAEDLEDPARQYRSSRLPM